MRHRAPEPVSKNPHEFYFVTKYVLQKSHHISLHNLSPKGFLSCTPYAQCINNKTLF